MNKMDIIMTNKRLDMKKRLMLSYLKYKKRYTPNALVKDPNKITKDTLRGTETDPNLRGSVGRLINNK